MQPNNLQINLPNDGGTKTLFKHFDSTCHKSNVIMSGSWYTETAEMYQTESRRTFVCPIILYVDKTFIDPMKSRLNLEPMNFTLGIFKRECRSQFAIWRTLGFIP